MPTGFIIILLLMNIVIKIIISQKILRNFQATFKAVAFEKYSD